MAEAAQPNPQGTPDTNAWFFKETSLGELVKNAKPLASMDELALDDLTTEEAIFFLNAIEE